MLSSHGSVAQRGLSWRSRGTVAALFLAFPQFACAGAQPDRIWSDSFDGFPVAGCDAGLASDTTLGMDFARSLGLCGTTSEAGVEWGVVSAELSLPSGAGIPHSASHALRSAFGSGNAPLEGERMVVLSTGTAAAPGQVNPAHVPFYPGMDQGTTSAIPADWLAAHAGVVPVAPGCPAPFNQTARDAVMLTLRIRAPGNARSFSLSANIFASDYAEYVCGSFNDIAVALLDSVAETNPADGNLATWAAPSQALYPLGVNLARDGTGLFRQCVNGATGCESGVPGTQSDCIGTEGLAGTGMDPPQPGDCEAGSLVGGASGWLELRGNVLPGELFELRIAIWDTGDGALDSVLLLDAFRWAAQPVTAGVGG